MIKVIEYAQLSLHTYYPNKSLFGRNISQVAFDRTKTINQYYDGWYYVSDVDSFINPGHHFYAALYVKFRSGQATNAVIAIRGTQLSWGNVKVDVESWQSDVLGSGKYDEVPVYYIKALQFFKKARNYQEQYFPKARLSITGHSLGGALAQLIAGIGHRPRTIVTFNSPGNGDIPGIGENMAHYVTGINSKYGFINKVGKPFGKVIYVDVPNEETAAKACFAAYHNEQKLIEEKSSTVNLADLNRRLNSDMTTARHDFILSCGAQHSINNMITALHNDPDLANQTFI